MGDEGRCIDKPSGYGKQTFHYTPSKDKIYVVWASTNTNMVRAYSGIAAKNPRQTDSWDINGTNTFEVEGGGLYNDTYWFSTYEGPTSSNAAAKNGRLFTHSSIQ